MGQHLFSAARSAGFKVYALVSDLTDSKALCDEISILRPTHVVHLAAISSVVHEDDSEFFHFVF